MMVFGKDAGRDFLVDWLQGKQNLVLVTGRNSYVCSGAEEFLAPYLAGKSVTHLTTVGENARAEDVELKRSQLPERMDAFVAIGGGTVIDTTKLVRGFTTTPFLAIPTTAGTGAEATRFAVYYDRGKKCSADDVRYLPTDQLLVPQFCLSASVYQQAACAFDAYAQAVESLWAKGATDESKAYALQALDMMAKGEQLLGSYWAGRAIDISRTTAAHALSYYMTSNFGIPHGHAVYMMFPYVCQANGHLEFVRQVPELQTLRDFAAEKKLEWSELVKALLANVNPQRLANNPGPITVHTFDANF